MHGKSCEHNREPKHESIAALLLCRNWNVPAAFPHDFYFCTRMKKRNIILLACAFALSLSAQFADTGSLEQAIVLSDRLHLSVEQTNRNMSILTAEDIRRLPVKSLAELLGWISGVDVRQRGPWGAQSDISLLGGTFEQTLVLVDGVRMMDPQTGHNMMNIPIPLEAIARIEVLKGPAARIYGLNALTGAINIVTRKAEKDFAEARLYAGTGGDRDTSTGDVYRNVGATTSAGFSRDKVNQVFSAGTDQGNGYRYNTAYRSYRLYNRTEIKINSNSRVQLMGGYARNHFGANAFYAAPGDKESEETVETGSALGRWIFQKGKTTVTPELSWRYNYDHYVYIRQKPEIYQNRHFTHSLTPAVHILRSTGWGRWSLGIEHRYDQIRSNNLGNRIRNNTGISGEIYYHRDRFYAIAGVYALHNSAFGTGFFPGLELGYSVRTNSRIFANMGTAQRIPSFTDLYYRGPSNVSNPALKPETSKNVEVGYRRNTRSLQIQAVGFLRRMEDLIDWVKDSAQHPWSPVNYNTSQTWGADIQATWLWKPAQNLHFRIRASYTWLKPGYLNAVEKMYSKNVFENLNQQAIGGISATIYQKVLLTLSGRHLIRNTMNAYTLWDAHLEYNARAVQLFFDINNIGNAQYREVATVPMPPRWTTMGVRISTLYFKKQ